MAAAIDLTGMRFGLITAIKFTGIDKHKKRLWLCACDCGNKTISSTGALMANKVMSCGCVRWLKIIKHGMSATAEYRAWSSMISRCEKKSHKQWRNYGARGIKVCDEWKDFNVFYLDVGRKPSPRHSLDRINNDGNYEPAICLLKMPLIQDLMPKKFIGNNDANITDTRSSVHRHLRQQSTSHSRQQLGLCGISGWLCSCK